MLAFTLRFPLGVYHALAPRPDRHDAAEWAPHPTRLIGALLAAAHEVPSADVDGDRAVLQRLCEAPPPLVYAPPSAPWDDPTPRPFATVAELRGASRWAPRNPSLGEAKDLSPRQVGRTRTAVAKSGVAIGDLPVTIAWPDLDLSDDDRDRVERMAGNVAWIGTSRSPVTVSVATTLVPAATSGTRWSPLPWDTDRASDATLRVPDPGLLDRFDAAFATRRSKPDRVAGSGLLQPANTGNGHPYAIEHGGPDIDTVDPEHWGRIAIVAIDEEGAATAPLLPAGYVLARSFRNALLATFEERGSSGDAPSVLHGRGDTPHLAVVPLADVGHRHATGRVLGLALAFPSARRRDDLAAETAAVLDALRSFFPEATDRRPIKGPRIGPIYVKPLRAGEERRWALNASRYTVPSHTWTTVTPAVLSRWPKRRNREDSLRDQVVADCAHVGLPEPESVEILRTPAVTGAATRLAPTAKLPDDWRTSLNGPTVHLRLRFPTPVRGPVLLGRARHFGVGLCVPERSVAP